MDKDLGDPQSQVKDQSTLSLYWKLPVAFYQQFEMEISKHWGSEELINSTFYTPTKRSFSGVYWFQHVPHSVILKFRQYLRCLLL